MIFEFVKPEISLDTVIGYVGLVATVYYASSSVKREERKTQEALLLKAQQAQKQAVADRVERLDRELRQYSRDRERHYDHVVSVLARMEEAAVLLADAAEHPDTHPNATRVEQWHVQLQHLPGPIKGNQDPTEFAPPLDGYDERVHELQKRVFESNLAAFAKYRAGRQGKLSRDELVWMNMRRLASEVRSQCKHAFDVRHGVE